MTTLPVYGGLNFASTVDAPPAPTEPAKPSEPAERQQTFSSFLSIGGYGKAPYPSLQTFWLMRRNPICGFAYSVTTAPIFAGTRTAAIRNADGTEAQPSKGIATGGTQVLQTTEDKRRKLLEDLFENLWPDILQGMECLNFGYWLHEVIWEPRLDTVAPARFKSFQPGEATLLRDKFNDFAGYQYGTGNDNKRDPAYAFLSVCNPQFDPIFGVPRAEWARQSWWRSEQCQDNGDRIERKASGIQMFFQILAGATFKDVGGNPIVSSTAVQTIVDAAQAGKSFTAPMVPWAKEDIARNPDLAKLPLIDVKEFDWGNTGPSLLAAISRLDRLDVEIFRAWGRPEREAMEGQHGTKAEAGTHGAIGTLDSEKIHGDLLRQLNEQVVNRWLVTNFGVSAKDSLYFKPTPLSDPQQQFKQAVVTAMLASPTTGPQANANIDQRDLLKQVELPLIAEGQVPKVAPIEQPGPPSDSGDDEGRAAA